MAIDTTPTPTPAPVAEQQAAPRLSARDRLILFVLCAAQFMVALDFSVLNVALPVLGADLGMSTSALQWAVTAFALPSGGFLLLFGRMGDLYGRRRLFLAGLALFGAASLLATLAWDPASFLAGRALQGLGAAAIVPTGMSLLTTTFPEGPARDRALGISGTLLSLGFTVGMVAAWRPDRPAELAFHHGPARPVRPDRAAPRAPPAARLPPPQPRRRGTRPLPERPRLDVPGAVTVTGGLLSLIYALTTAAEHGFGRTDVLVTLGAGLLLLAAFVAVESRSAAPLVSLPMLRRRTVAWGNLGGLVTFSTMSTVVFVLTLYLQEVLRLSAFETGLVFGVQGLLSVVAGSLAPRVIGRFGARRTLVGSLAGQGLLGLPLLVMGEGSWSVVLATAAVSLASMCHLGAIISYGLTVTSGVPDEEQGLATGLVTSTQQVGITVGIPLLGVLATTATDLRSGVHTVLVLDAAIVLAAAVLVAVGLRSNRPAGSGAVEAEPLRAR